MKTNKFKSIGICVNVRKAERKGLASGVIDIPLNTVYVLYFVYCLQPSASFLGLMNAFRRAGKTLGPLQLKNRIDLLAERGYLVGTSWGKVEITPGGVNVLESFNQLLNRVKT